MTFASGLGTPILPMMMSPNSPRTFCISTATALSPLITMPITPILFIIFFLFPKQKCHRIRRWHKNVKRVFTCPVKLKFLFIAVLHSDQSHRLGLLFLFIIYYIIFNLSTLVVVVCENCCIVPDTANRQIARHLLYLGAMLDCALEKWDIWMNRKEGAFATGRSILVVCENCCIVPDIANRQIAHFSPVVGFSNAVLMHRGFNKESLCLLDTCHCTHTVCSQCKIQCLCFCKRVAHL